MKKDLCDDKTLPVNLFGDTMTLEQHIHTVDGVAKGGVKRNHATGRRRATKP